MKGYRQQQQQQHQQDLSFFLFKCYSYLQMGGQSIFIHGFVNRQRKNNRTKKIDDNEAAVPRRDNDAKKRGRQLSRGDTEREKSEWKRE